MKYLILLLFLTGCSHMSKVDLYQQDITNKIESCTEKFLKLHVNIKDAYKICNAIYRKKPRP